MTKNEFVENIRDWSDLLQFCNEYGCDYCSDVYDDDEKDSYINDSIVSMARDADDWQHLYSQLCEIPTGCDYYILDGSYWREADDSDFVEYKLDIIAWGDGEGIWDEDEESLVKEYTDEEPLDDEVEIEEGCSINELFASGATKLQTIKIEATQKREREAKLFEQFLASDM